MENLGNMMAEVATLVNVAKSIVNSLAAESLSCHTAQKLQNPVSRTCQLLLAAEKNLMLIAAKKKKVSGDDSATLKSWVRELSKAVYEARELVDEVAANSAAASFASNLHCRSLFGLSRSSSGIFGVRMGPKINRLCNEFTQLWQAGTDCSLLDFEAEHETFMTEPREEVENSITEMRSFIGRKVEKEEVVNSLLDTSDPNQHISVVAIIGMGGIGKTTLAKLVYNDERITDHFDLKFWATVTMNFDLTLILRSIIKSSSAASLRTGDLPLEQLMGLLRAEISGKIFFLVLDDVWSVKEWLSLKSLLMVGARGSKILLTTRFLDAAKESGSDPLFRLDRLNDDDAWALFREIALCQLEKETPNLVYIGKKIASLCAGVPLAVSLIANALRRRSVEQWQDALHLLTSSKESIFDFLYFIYSYLPSSLKACFAYCFLFPENYEIHILDLVSLWMAQGFIEPESFIDMEDVAEQYSLALCSHGFCIDIEKDEYGNIVKFKMHSLIYDLALLVTEGWGTIIHFSCFHRSCKTLFQRTFMMDECKLQTFLCWNAADNEDDGGRKIGINDIVERSKFKSLQVLDLHAFGIEMLPDSIGNLIRLRYLDLSHNGSLQKLPNSIAKLHHLQTLKLDFCYELKELPNSFKKLVCLRRLELDGCEKLTYMPPGFENLSSLRTLSRYLVGKPRSQFASGLKSLGNLNHLRGRLMIELSDNWSFVVNEAAKSNLSNKSRLTELGIKWGPTRHTRETDAIQHQQLLDGLQPPYGLKGLQIEGYRGQDFPSWARGKLAIALPNLVTVSIDGCGQCKNLPPFSCLPRLKRLSLHFMHDVEFFEDSDNQSSTSVVPFFPYLVELTLHCFYSLEGWWEEEAQTRSVSFNHLRKLKLWSCPKLKSMPLFPKVKELDMQNINEKLLEFHNAQMTRSELETSMQPSSSHSDISHIEPRENSENLQCLETLHIKACPRLETLVFMKSSKKLKKLVVERLDVLISLNEVLKQLNDLEELEIAGCKNLDLSGGCQSNWCVSEECGIPWKNLSKLNHLTLRELPKLVNLPVGLRFTTTLRTLCISTCDSLKALPECIHSLTSLQHLKLEGCPEVTMLPEGLKHIHSLVKVDILECPQLMERCRNGGEDWHKIKHARVLCHKSWRYALMSDAGILQKPKNHGDNVVVR